MTGLNWRNYEGAHGVQPLIRLQQIRQQQQRGDNA